MNTERQPSILITGANRGLGLGLVTSFLAQGWYVIGTYRSLASAADLQALQQDYPEHLLTACCDVTSDESVNALFQEIAQHISSLDILVNNAGLLIKGEDLIEHTSSANLLQTLDTNVVGPLRITQAFLPLIRRGQHKKIIHISSIMGSLARSGKSTSRSYRISKAGLNMLSRTLAAELHNEQIISLKIHPGWVQTDMGGAQASISIAESVAGLVSFILRANFAEHSGGFYDYQGHELPF